MTVLAWLILLALLTLLFSQYDRQQENPNRNIRSQTVDGTVEVRLVQNRGGHYIASGEINNVPVTFMLDTGATLISIPERMAEAMGLIRGPRIPVETANGTIKVYLTRLAEVRLGDIVLYDVKATINPRMDDDTVLLGMSFLKDLEFVQQNDQLVIRQN